MIQDGLVLSLDASDRNSYTAGNGIELVTNPALLNPNDGQTVIVSRTAISQSNASGLGTMVSGSFYILNYTVTVNTGSMSSTFRIAGSGGNLSPLTGINGGVTGSFSTVFQALNTGALTLNGDDVNTYMILDYISVQQSSTTWFDLSGNNMVANMSGSIPFSGSLVQGAFTFRNSGSFIISENSALNTQTPTVEVWARTNALSQNGFWFEKGNVNTQYSLFQEGTNIIWRQYIIEQGTYRWIQAATATYINTNNWFQVVGTYISGTRRLYVNGILASSDSQTGTIGTNTNGASIGVFGGFNGVRGYYYNGNISTVKVYNRALSQAEILQNYNAQKTRFGIYT